MPSPEPARPSRCPFRTFPTNRGNCRTSAFPHRSQTPLHQCSARCLLTGSAERLI
ncbi:hypothetical protein C8R48DRAFT_688546, partial [Suillus tomentosus]